MTQNSAKKPRLSLQPEAKFMPAFDNLARSRFKLSRAALAQEILNEFLSCYSTDEEVREVLGDAYIERRTHGLICGAYVRARAAEVAKEAEAHELALKRNMELVRKYNAEGPNIAPASRPGASLALQVQGPLSSEEREQATPVRYATSVEERRFGEAMGEAVGRVMDKSEPAPKKPRGQHG